VPASAGANSDITSLNAPAIGAATATTQAANDNSTKVATTAYADRLKIATQVAPGTDGNVLVASGGAWTSAAGGSEFTKSYTSADQTITLAGLLTLAHSLGVAPKLISPRLKCTSTDAGFAVNDVVEINNSLNGGGQAIYSDATNIYIRFSNNAYNLPNKTTGINAALTSANWKLIMRAWA